MVAKPHPFRVPKSDTDTCTRWAIWMAKIDGCPECVVNTETPLRVRETFTNIAGFQADYRCTDCGHRWTTAWVDESDGA